MNSETDEESDYDLNLDWLTRYPSCTNRMFHIVGSAG